MVAKFGFLSDPDIKLLRDDYRAKHGGFEAETLHLSKPVVPHRVKVIGEIRRIYYTSSKKFEDPNPRAKILFFHDNEAENKPFYASGEGAHAILGGGYTVTDHGIEDDVHDKRSIPRGIFTADLRSPERCVGMGKMYGLVLKGGKEIDLRSKHLILAYAKIKGSQTLFLVPECMTSDCKWSLK